MPKLPDATALGSPAIPQARRSVLSYDAGVQSRAAETAMRGIMQSQESLYRAEQGVRDSMQGLGKTVDEIGKNYKDRQDRFDIAQSKMSWMRADIEARAELENDPDYTTWNQRYEARMGPVRQQIRAKIKDPDQAALFDMDMELGMARAKAELTSSAFKAEGFHRTAWAEENTEELKRLYVATKDPLARQTILENGRAMFSALEPYLGPVETGRRSRNWTNDAVFEDYQLRAETDPDGLMAELFPTAPATAPVAEPEVEGAPPAADGTPPPTSAGTSSFDVYWSRVVMVESNGKASAINPKSGAAGDAQWMKGTASRFGVNNPHNPEQSREGGEKMTEENRGFLKKALGREPSDAELYLAHQQGPGGGPALLANQNANAVDVLTKVYARIKNPDTGELYGPEGGRKVATKAVLQNGGRVDMTAGQFASQQMAKFTGTDPGGYVSYMARRGTPADVLSIGQQLQLKRTIETAQKRKQAEFQVGVVSRVGDDIAMAAAGKENPTPLTMQDFSSAYGAEEAVEKFDQYSNGVQTAKDSYSMALKSPAEQKALIDDYTPKPGEGFKEQADRQQKLREVQAAVNEGWADDPAAMSMQYGILSSEQLDVDNPDVLKGQLARRVATIGEEARKRSIPMKVLTNGEAFGMAEAMKKMTSGEQGLTLDTLRQATNNDAAYMAMMKQISPNAPSLAVAGALRGLNAKQVTSGPRVISRPQELAAATVGNTILRGLGLRFPPSEEGQGAKKAEGSKPIIPMPPQSDFEEEFNAALGGIFRNTPEQARMALDASMSVYAALSSDEGDVGGEMDLDRFEKAVKMVVGEPVEVGGSKVLPPWGMDEADFIDKAEEAFPWAVRQAGLDPSRFRLANVSLLNTSEMGVYHVFDARGVLGGRNGELIRLDLNAYDRRPAAPISE